MSRIIWWFVLVSAVVGCLYFLLGWRGLYVVGVIVVATAVVIFCLHKLGLLPPPPPRDDMD